jgi:ABC-type transporter Mla maintaining outer membrane lipid asymmetry ATPase subunit MlaF
MTHVRRLAEYVFFMYQGKVETSGSVGDMLSKQSNPHLRQYLRVYGGGTPESDNPEAGK